LDAADVLGSKLRRLRKVLRKLERCCFSSILNNKKELSAHIDTLERIQESRDLDQAELANLQSLQLAVQVTNKREEIMPAGET